MFNYVDFDSIDRDGFRLYQTPNGNLYPSVTTVFGRTAPQEKIDALAKWKNSLGPQAEEICFEAARHGTAVHLIIEHFLKDLPLPDISKINTKDCEVFNSLIIKLKKIEQIWCQEQALHSDFLQLAGRTDCIGIYGGRPSIIDFKTSSKIKHLEDIADYKLQLCAYAIMHNEQYGTDIDQGVILMASAGGFPQEFVIDIFDFADELIERVDLFYKMHPTLKGLKI